MSVTFVPVQPGVGTTPPASTATQNNPNDLSNPLTEKQTFISLLVAQLKNQDPLNPTDPNQFLSQLSEINSVEQLVGIRQDTDAMQQALTSLATPPTDGSSSSGSGSSNGAGAGKN